MPVPKLVGQEWMWPYLASSMKSRPDSFFTESPTALMPLARRSKTPFTSPPACMEMILSWSSSLTQVRKVLSLLWKIPRPSGQSLSMPATFRFLSPGEEGFVLVMEDSATLWPISLHARNLQVLVPGHEEEMIIDQLLPDLLLHACQGEVGASKITSQVSKCLPHQVLNAKALVLGDSRGQAEPVDVATNTDAGGVDRSGGVDGAFDFGRIHVAGVCGVGSDAMVLLDQRVEHV